MKHFLEQFGPCPAALDQLTDVPDLMTRLDRIVDQSDAQAAGRSVSELEEERDANLHASRCGRKMRGWCVS